MQQHHLLILRGLVPLHDPFIHNIEPSIVLPPHLFNVGQFVRLENVGIPRQKLGHIVHAQRHQPGDVLRPHVLGALEPLPLPKALLVRAHLRGHEAADHLLAHLVLDQIPQSAIVAREFPFRDVVVDAAAAAAAVVVEAFDARQAIFQEVVHFLLHFRRQVSAVGVDDGVEFGLEYCFHCFRVDLHLGVESFFENGGLLPQRFLPCVLARVDGLPVALARLVLGTLFRLPLLLLGFHLVMPSAVQFCSHFHGGFFFLLLLRGGAIVDIIRLLGVVDRRWPSSAGFVIFVVNIAVAGIAFRISRRRRRARR
mmetsp:Transcript_34347/g.72344  ORF Transcript_34347/g.72344 Transcript_34347/m.72344 type:complete len:310 (+) Transcript_34347:2949-3878(+)